jgi:S-formylglutathione hydrolase FrmB
LLVGQTHQFSIPLGFYCDETAKWRFRYQWNTVVQKKMARLWDEAFVMMYKPLFEPQDDPLDWVIE